MQAKLLRVLETGEVTRVGASEGRRFDVHVIAATNRTLAVEVALGRFRSDLYYRLDVVEVHVPPLRDRDGDVRLLAEWFLHRAAARFGRAISRIDDQAARQLESCGWPGNVRQLRHTIERAAMLAEATSLTTADLHGLEAAPAVVTAPALRVVRRIDDLEKEAIETALANTRGNKKEAARRLGISRRALYGRLEKFGLDRRAA